METETPAGTTVPAASEAAPAPSSAPATPEVTPTPAPAAPEAAPAPAPAAPEAAPAAVPAAPEAPVLKVAEPPGEPLLDQLASFWQNADQQIANMLLPSRLIQLGVLVFCIILSWGMAKWIAPKVYAWMKQLEGRPKWQLRILVFLHKRLQLIAFILLTWIANAIMAELSPFTSRRYLLALAATIATAWFLVAVAARVVNNRFLRRVVTWGLWIYVTLFYLGQIDAASTLLDTVGMQFGDFRISALTIIKALVVTGVLFALARFTSKTAAARVQKNEDLSPSMRVLLVKFLQVALFGAAFFLGLKAIGADLTGLAVLSGAIGLGLGFGMQKVVSNLVSGVIILLDKSIKPGDVISLDQTFGWISTLGARYASVVTRDGREYLIPNEDLITGQVVNWSHSDAFVRLDIGFGTSYANDPHLVRQIAIEAAQSVERVLGPPKQPVCHIVGFGDSSVDYTLRFWIDDPTGGLTNIRGNVYLALWDRFKEHDISIPFPQREVRVLDDVKTDKILLDD